MKNKLAFEEAPAAPAPAFIFKQYLTIYERRDNPKIPYGMTGTAYRTTQQTWWFRPDDPSGILLVKKQDLYNLTLLK